MTRLSPINRTAKQLLHRADGNPPSSLPDSAISNCYPGLEFDFRNIWRRIFAGIELHEADCYVTCVTDDTLARLLHCRLLKVDGHDMTTVLRGPREPGGPTVDLATPANPDAAWFMEWSNSLSRVLAKAGTKVSCVFTAEPSVIERRADWPATQSAELEIRALFEPGAPVIARELVEPGDLTQSLCSPWQNDYRECACYYWASSRPDFVDVVPGRDGLSAGFNWMDRRLSAEPPAAEREYLPDPRPRTPTDPVWITYDELFQHWQTLLQVIVGGSTADQSGDKTGK
jgi:hypothetical protein